MNVVTLDSPKILFKTHPHASINKTTEVLNYIEERQKTSNFINFSKNKDILQESHRNLVFVGISSLIFFINVYLLINFCH